MFVELLFFFTSLKIAISYKVKKAETASVPAFLGKLHRAVLRPWRCLYKMISLLISEGGVCCKLQQTETI